MIARLTSHMTLSDMTNYYSSSPHRFPRKYKSVETFWITLVQCITTEGIHDNDILFAMKRESKRLQSSAVLLGVVTQIKGFKVSNITTNSKRLQDFNFVPGEQT